MAGVTAVCILVGQIFGTILLQQESVDDKVWVEANITGLQPGQHGFHIHEWGDVRNSCMNARGHYNPFNEEHAGPDEKKRHVGDLGNILAGPSGEAHYPRQAFDLIQLQGHHSVIGKAFVVHSGVDDLGKGGQNDSKTTGHAGSRVACCVIGLGKSD